MTGVWIVLGAVLLVVLIGAVYERRRAQRRAEIRGRPLDPGSRRILERTVPLYRRLPASYEERFEGLVQLFLDELSFEACGGLAEVTDEMRLAVAGQACLLLLDSGYEDFGRLRSILLYPDAYTVKDEFGMEDVRLGESWETGSVVLSWESVTRGAANPEDGLNVVLHEFAHQLDQSDGEADGVPVLKMDGDYRRWAEAFRKSYDRLCERLAQGRRTVLDPYGATNPAEFFAVATETFFEKPKQLHREHPDVYGEMRQFYGLDPRRWRERGGLDLPPS